MTNRVRTFQRIGRPLAAAILSGLAVSAQAQFTNVITVTSFEQEVADPATPSGRPTYSYAYKYDWGGTAPSDYFHNFNTWYTHPDDLSMTNYYGAFTFSNLGYQDFVANNAGSGYGMGFGGGLNWTNAGTVFTSTNLSDYTVSFDARVEGLKPDSMTVNGEFQMRFIAPDDTIQPADSNTSKDTLIQVNLNFNASSNWQRFSFKLDQGSIADGKTDKDFVLYRAAIDEPAFGVNYHMPHDAFAYDDNNAVYVDNIKLTVTQSAPPPPAPPRVPFTVFDYNWDDKPIWYAWAGGQGWSAGVKATYYVTNNAAGVGVGGSNAYIMGMDNSAMVSDPPAWAGGNTGGGGAADYSQMKSPDLADYVVVLDGRVEGLAPDALSTGGTLQLHVIAPDDTIQPADADTNNDFLTRLDFSIPDMATNWQTFVLPLSKASIGSGSKANFTNYFNKISEIQFQIQINNANSGNTWGFDADNLMIIDNLKLQYLAIGAPPIVTEPAANNGLVLKWAPPTTGSLKLQSAANPAGPYTDVTGATSPYTTSTTGTPKYFRTIWVPPSN